MRGKFGNGVRCMRIGPGTNIVLAARGRADWLRSARTVVGAQETQLFRAMMRPVTEAISDSSATQSFMSNARPGALTLYCPG